MMTCSICHHERRMEIDQALVAGEPLRAIAARTGTSKSAIMRHRDAHLPKLLADAKAAQAVEFGGSLLERLQTINRETREILADARSTQNPIIALAAITRIERQLEIEAKLLGQIPENHPTNAVTINILGQLTDPELELLGKAFERAQAERLKTIEGTVA